MFEGLILIWLVFFILPALVVTFDFNAHKKKRNNYILSCANEGKKICKLSIPYVPSFSKCFDDWFEYAFKFLLYFAGIALVVAFCLYSYFNLVKLVGSL